jgi:1-deoxy-D-xylulose-5-phosphate reductoisomerase
LSSASRIRGRSGAGATAPLRVLAGDAGIAEVIETAAQTAREDGVPLTVLNGIVGAAGLRATMVALRCGATLALANKESMVAGGPFVLQAARENGAAIIPVDSEHSAIFQCLAAGRPGAVDAGPALANPLLPPEEILLTGSGGPFRGFSREQLTQVTSEQALHHPNWVMGPKVTIDSATLMNKGLEVIEAHYLFGVPYEQIRVVIHPQSIVHSLVRYGDGAVLAHLGVPDMRTPIGYALTYPKRVPLPMVSPLDLSARELSFLPPDTTSFRCLALAQAAGQTAAAAQAAGRPAGGGAPIVLNAANEIAVHAFLAGRLSFLGIADLVEQTLGRLADVPVGSLDDVFALDGEARRVAAEQLGV